MNREYVYVCVVYGAELVPVSVPRIPIMVSLTVIVPFVIPSGVVNAPEALPVTVLFCTTPVVTVALAMLMKDAAVGGEEYVQMYGHDPDAFGPRVMLLPPPLMPHTPPLLITSDRLNVMPSQLLGLLTEMLPWTVQPLSCALVCVAVTV